MEILHFVIENGEKLHWHSWKEQFKISKMAKFGSDSEDIVPQSL